MITFTKEQLIASAHARIEFAEMMLAGELEPLKERTWSIELELARIALVSLEAEVVSINDDMAYAFHHALSDSSLGAEEVEEIKAGLRAAFANVTAPPAPLSVPAAMEMDDDFDSAFEHGKAVGWNAYRAAILQGVDIELQSKAAIHDALCVKYNVESLADFVDWQRNHIAELEAAPPAPVSKGETAVMPDYPGYALTQRECYQAGKKAGVDELVTTAYKLPANTPCKDAPEHIWLQTAGVWPENGEFSELTWCSDNQHQDDTLYVRADVVTGNSPVISDGWVMVPVELTPDMRAAWDSAPNTDDDDYNMQAAYRAMIAAAPQQEVK